MSRAVNHWEKARGRRRLNYLISHWVIRVYRSVPPRPSDHFPLLTRTKGIKILYKVTLEGEELVGPTDRKLLGGASWCFGELVHWEAMIGENRHLFTDEPVEFEI